MCRFAPRTGSLPDLLSTVIESPRLRLIHTSENDADNILRAFNADITRYMFPKPAESLIDTLEFIAASREATAAWKNLQLTISLKTTGEFLGCCGLHGHDSARVPELGVWTKRQAHGHGYGREAVFTLVGWAVATLDLTGFVYPVDRRNSASRKIPEALAGEVVSTGLMSGLGGNPLEIITYRIDAETAHSKLQKLRLGVAQ